MKWSVLLFLAVTLTGVDFDAKDAGKKDLEKMQGTWNLQARQDEGREDKPRELGSAILVIMGNRFSLNEDGMVTEGNFVLDAGKKPAWIELVPAGSKEKLLGIYQIEGGLLKVCYARTGAERPTEFATKEKSRQVLMTFKKK